jgi:hypothetical protein
MQKLGGLLLAGAIMAPGVALAGPYDGTYHGTLTGTDGNANTCAKQAPVQMSVADNKLTYNHLSNATITATVGADGSFSGSTLSKFTIARSGPLNLTLDGRIAGDRITAVSKVSGYCTYNLQLQKFR